VALYTYILRSIGLLLLLSSTAHADVLGLTHQEMRDVVKIARAISVVQPRLEDAKYITYGLGIYRASLRYNVEPSVLIAITQQETGFRENLPEGRAGELGICQVLKSWLKNPRFRKEFKNATEKDFMTAAKSFMFSAWILSDLKARTTKGSLPYWSFYNANQFHNRFKYFLAVNRYVAALKKKEHLFNDRAVAAIPEPPPQVEVPPAPIAKASVPPPPQYAVKAKAVRPQDNYKESEAALVPKFRMPVSSQWIPDAIHKIRARFASRKTTDTENSVD